MKYVVGKNGNVHKFPPCPFGNGALITKIGRDLEERELPAYVRTEEGERLATRFCKVCWRK